MTWRVCVVMLVAFGLVLPLAGPTPRAAALTTCAAETSAGELYRYQAKAAADPTLPAGLRSVAYYAGVFCAQHTKILGQDRRPGAAFGPGEFARAYHDPRRRWPALFKRHRLDPARIKALLARLDPAARAEVFSDGYILFRDDRARRLYLLPIPPGLTRALAGTTAK